MVLKFKRFQVDVVAQASAAAKTSNDFFMSSPFKSSVGEISGIGSHTALHKELQKFSMALQAISNESSSNA
jgi:hypothetical protein